MDDDVQYRLNFDNEYTFKSNHAEIESTTVVTEYGFNVEVRIPFRFLEAAAGVKLAFDLQINDDSGTGSRTSYAKWNDATNESYRNTAGFGT